MAARFFPPLKEAFESGVIPVIPDIKCISPKLGDLTRGRDPVGVAKELSGAGAPVFSVVTEREQFGGSLGLLEKIVLATGKPVLRKDFIRTKEELERSKQYGASAVLLICSILEEEELFSLYAKAVSLGLEPLVEVHTERELQMASGLPLRMVGVNNRDITVLEKDGGSVGSMGNLMRKASKEAFLISESAISCREDISLAAECGAGAALVGTAIWQADDPAGFYRSLRINRRTG